MVPNCTVLAENDQTLARRFLLLVVSTGSECRCYRRQGSMKHPTFPSTTNQNITTVDKNKSGVDLVLQ